MSQPTSPTSTSPPTNSILPHDTASSATIGELQTRVFPDRKSATAFVQDIALAQGKRAIVDTRCNGGRNYRLICSSPTPCSFFVRISKRCSATVQGYNVSGFDLAHHGCSGKPIPTERRARQLTTAQASVRAQAAVPAKAIISAVKIAHGVDIASRMAYRLKHRISEEADGEYKAGFAQLDSLLSSFCAKNPGSHYAVEFDSSGHFQRAFLSHPYAKAHNKYGQSVFGTDGTFMKHGLYKSSMLVLVGRTGNNANFLAAIALCPGETAEHCEWFFRQCSLAGIDFERKPLFADRGRALLAAFAQRGDMVIRFCTRHIIGNTKHHFGKLITVDIERAIWEIQASQSVEEFQGRLRALKVTHKSVADYIEGISPESWALYPSLNKFRLYGRRTTNFVESQNNTALPIRQKHAFAVFSETMEQWMTDAFKQDQVVAKWRLEGLRITPYAEKLLSGEQDRAAFLNVLPSSDSVAFVRDDSSTPAINRRVDIAARTRTCVFMDQYGVPCRHMIATLRYYGKSEVLYDAFDLCYHLESISAGYGATLNKPIEQVLSDEIQDNNKHLPPLSDAHPGRKRQKRIRSRGENV